MKAKVFFSTKGEKITQVTKVEKKRTEERKIGEENDDQDVLYLQ